MRASFDASTGNPDMTMAAAMGRASIRVAAREDLDGLVAIYAEMESHFYGDAGAPPALVRERLESALFGERPAAEAVIALDAGRIVGISIFSVLFPGVGASTTAFIMELFVSAHSRGHGVGRGLLSALAELALERGYSRLEWTTEAHNKGAQAFYRQYPAARVDRVFYRLDGAALQRIAGA